MEMNALENTLIIQDGEQFCKEETSENYTKLDIVSLEGREGRYIVTDNFRNVINLYKIPEDVNEEEYLLEYKRQIELAQPVYKED